MIAWAVACLRQQLQFCVLLRLLCLAAPAAQVITWAVVSSTASISPITASISPITPSISHIHALPLQQSTRATDLRSQCTKMLPSMLASWCSGHASHAGSACSAWSARNFASECTAGHQALNACTSLQPCCADAPVALASCEAWKRARVMTQAARLGLSRVPTSSSLPNFCIVGYPQRM
jgi:hypothetical protein